MTADDVRDLLRKDIARVGTLMLWARAHNVSRQYVYDVLKSARPPGEPILKALGLQRTEAAVSYERSA